MNVIVNNKLKRILFACTWNAVRSPIAEGLMNLIAGNRFPTSVKILLGETVHFG